VQEPGSAVENFYETLARTMQGAPQIEQFRYKGSLLNTLDLYIEQFHRPRGGAKAAYCDGYITTAQSLLDDDDFPCNYHTEKWLRSHENVGYISQLFTHIPYRRRGWGAMLLREWLLRAKSYDVTGVYLNVAETPWLKEFYARNGFEMLDDGTLHDTTPMMGISL